MAESGVDQKEVASVFVEQEDGGYLRVWCKYSDLFAADIAISKSRKFMLDVYTSEGLAPKSRMSVDASLVFRANNDDANGAQDMTALTYLEEPNMLQCLQSRYDHDNIYTNIAGVLVAVNPWKQLGVYSVDYMAKYRAQRRLDLLPPHIFAVAEKAYQELRSKRENQSMICCGESGSGKTVSTKMLMRYLANITVISASNEAAAHQTSLVEQQVLQANPLLEAFGNAKTLMNENSSRFAKFTKLFVSNEEGRIMGAHTETYLLEKSRVVHPNKGERNFHVFYQVAAGLGAQLGLPAAEKLSFLNSGGCIALKNVDDAANFKELCDCMTVLDFTAEDQQVVFGLVAAIMLLGNVRFDSDSVSAARRGTVAPGSGQPTMTLSADSKDCIARAASFIGVDVAALEKRLTSRRIKISSKEEIERGLEGEEAVSNRDSLIKSLYNALFGWVVSRINSVLYRGEVDTVNWIGLLDVFGFECFENNSFEQFCINFANEKLQEFFNSYILKSEQAEYRKEGIFWTPIQIPDNTDVISLISSKPSGILCLLDSACIMPKGGPETFAANLFAVHGTHPRLLPANAKNVPALKLTANPATALEAKKEKDRQQRLNVPGAGKDKANSFYVRHYAGYVVYDPQHFLGKNADATNPDTVVLFTSSKHELVKSLFAEELEFITLTQQGTRFVSVGSTFSKQLAALMETLQQTTPYFIRCASPNNLQQAGKFAWTYVKPQLRCGGLVEALRMLKFGYPSRVKYDVIFERYGQHLQPLPPNLNHRNFCEAVLAAFGLGRSQYQLGLTKVFFRPGKQEFLDTIFRRSDEPLTPEIHAFIRKWLIKRRWQRAVQSVMTHMWCSKRLAHIRSAHMFRHAIRIGMIYLQTLRKYLYKIRRLGKARKNAVTTIQAWFRHSYRRRALASNVNTRIKNKRKDRFKMMGLDAKSADELNMLRIQMQSIKKKEEAEKKKLEEAQKEAQIKELQLQKVMEEKQREMERLQREMENLKQKDIEAAQQAEMVAELKMRTQKLREENERNAQAARMIMLQREADAKKKQEEIERLRSETERKLKEHEQAQEELKRQKEEERKRREEDLAVLKMQTESMREEHESRAKEALRQLQEREEANRKKEEELAKLKAHAEKLKAEHVQETEELRQQREAERLQKEEEQARLKSEIDRMKLELDAEAVAFQNSLRAREEENKRKERELAVIKMEAERVKQEQEEFIKQLQTQREQERQRKEEELRRMQQEAAETQKYYEDQAAQQARLLAEREEENRRKEEVLAQLAAAAAEERRVHEDLTREAAEKLKELEQTSAAEKERLRLEREEALRQHEATLVRLQEEGKKELEEQLRRRDEAAQSAQESMKAQHESAVQQLQLHILSLEQEIENLNDRADRSHASHIAEVAQLTAALRAQEATTRDRDLKIFDLRTEVSNMKKAHAELNAISERLLAEAQEEHRRTRAEHKQAVNQMRDANQRLQQQYDKLQRDYNDVVAHFQQEMQSASESKALSDKRRNTRQKSAMPNPDTFREEMSKLRLELSRSRMISTAEMRPDFSALLSASITAQKTAKDFEASLKTKAGWLMKRRPGNRILGKGPKLRYHVLEGGVMSWYKDEKDAPRPGVAGKPLGSLEIKHYEFVKYDAEEKGGDTVIYMVTREGRSKEELELLVPPQKELPAGAATENLLEWVHEINKRNAVMNYLDVIFAQDQRSKGCRELLEFVTDSTATELRVENKVVDVHSALTALFEPLKHRKGFKKLILNNIALSDPSVVLFSDIIAKNTEIEHIELTWNLLTAKGAQALAAALKSNKSVRTVLLDHNSIGDQGLSALASALPLHKTIYRVSLSANKISDDGVKDFAESLIQSGPDHVFPLLEFAENLIGNSGAAALARLCAVNKSITRLNLRSNLVSDDGVIALAETLKSKKSGLGDVRLSNNQISNRGVIALSDAMNVTNQEVSFDLSHNRLVSRSGLTSLVSAEFPLEFALLKVVRGVEDPVAETARLIRAQEREQQAALFVQEIATTSRPSVPSRISVSTAPFAPRRAAAMTVAIPEEPVTPVRLSVASRHIN